MDNKSERQKLRLKVVIQKSGICNRQKKTLS